MTSNHLSTREQILMMLKRNGSLTVSEIAIDLGITEMAVRRHLNTLERDELIRSSLVRQAMGRPTNLYSLTDKAENQFPKAYLNLALDLLESVFEKEGREQIKELFKRREERLRKQYKNRLQDNSSLAEKVNLLVNIQNEKGYMAELEEKAEGYLIKEYNCPISEVAKYFNEACEGERTLFHNLLDSGVESLQCMARGDHSCVYLIKK